MGLYVLDLGAFDLHNLAAPVELFEIGLYVASEVVAVAPVCRMQVPRIHAAGRLRYGDTQYWFCTLTCASFVASDPARYAPTLD